MFCVTSGRFNFKCIGGELNVHLGLILKQPGSSLSSERECKFIIEYWKILLLNPITKTTDTIILH